MFAHSSRSGLRGTARRPRSLPGGTEVARLGQQAALAPCAPSASVQQPGEAWAPGDVPISGHRPARAPPRPPSPSLQSPRLCPGRRAGWQGGRARRLGSWPLVAWPPSGAGQPRQLHSARGQQPVTRPPSPRWVGPWGRHSSSRRPGSSGNWPLCTGRARSPSQIPGMATAGRINVTAWAPPDPRGPARLAFQPGLLGPLLGLTGLSRKSTHTWL